MADKAVSPTHFKLLLALKAVGPYLRELESKESMYLFDCLSVCVDDKQPPEEREFWGWWMELESVIADNKITNFVAKFQVGLYDREGKWQVKELPEKAKPEVVRTQQEFLNKLSKMLDERFSLGFEQHEESEEFA